MHSDGAERFETVIIGGGQAGLAAGYHLAKRGVPFVILDASERIGDAWRNRWDSLRLFTPAKYDGLPGWRFPASKWTFPTKDEMADYLEAYAERFDLPVRSGVSVNGLSRDGDRYVVVSGERRFEADRIVVATGAERVPKLPPFAFELDTGIVLLHSSDYRNPGQLREGDVLVVGLGNSGAEIAFELSKSKRTWLSGKPSGQIPVRHGSRASRFGFPIFRFAGTHVLTKGTPIGRKVGPKVATMAAPLVRVKTKDLVAAGVERVPRVVGVREGKPVLEDDRVLEVANVIWCTGYRQEFSWIDLPIFGEDGEPVHDRGVVVSEPGMYFMGLIFQYAVASDVLPGVGRDAKYIARHIATREAERRAFVRQLPVTPAGTPR
ncbi:MAG TPA: NAD(P)-binding domain-containing protein [Actinomycetota bacterium]|nr:NAD(P)-binding domain-containing protein [Actinomycetota bacterium]